VPADAASRYVIAACDGTRNRDELITELVARVQEGKLHVNEGSVPVTAKEKLRPLLASSVDNALAGLANTGFFAP
jgi:methyltransferase-like protein